VPDVFICTDVHAVTVQLYSITQYLLSVCAVCFISVTVVLADNLIHCITLLLLLAFFLLFFLYMLVTTLQLLIHLSSIIANFLMFKKVIDRN